MRKTAVIIGAGLLALSACGSGESSGGGAAGAQSECEDQVRAKFKTPSTVEFLDVDVREHDESVSIVSGTVTGENGFGGTVEHAFNCTMRSTESGWDADVQVTD